ncbi:hypothetical protein FG87_26815 [Nocardia vulneris]|uniref:Uncharacterized protein n=1 Tax=Nocardia vulneris TaxID=1141657 RepID=A0ABR4ZA76_9NOCA|nr:hypothetical protein FG87_26815 [Nocardia vulneris]
MARRRLNETFYRRFYIEDMQGPGVSEAAGEMKPIFGDLHEAARTCRGAALDWRAGDGGRGRSPPGGWWGLHPHKQTERILRALSASRLRQ